MSNDYDDELAQLKNKVKVFHEHKIGIHIFLKNGEWRRGEIVKTFDDYFMLNERIMGEIPIFFVDVSGVDKIKVKGNG